MNKNQLRKLYKQKRKDLTEEQINLLQKNIYNQVFTLNFSLVNTIHIFLPIEKQNEINTYPIIDFLREKNKKIVISKSNFTNNTLEHFVFDEKTELEVNKYGIPEPINAKKIDVNEIDLIFVPLLISDTKNYRVGYGKGFYDRFISNCKDGVKTIGLNFFKPIEIIEDVNEYDMALDFVIYPK
ncbi:MAG: 5-formyltetrahydrofolate cyclo-ligase [Tenacibaculum sp.]|nr:5-formyltetrahydrofolate cyclo-ligase [Tenacibaculum sp.]